MEAGGVTLRLYVLGQLKDGKQPQTLVTFAEFEDGRAVERIRLVPSQIKDLTKRIRDLQGFIEGGHPPLEEPLLVELGSKLFDLVIRGHVRSLFDMATGQREGFLPLELFLEDYTIAGWPWEYLYDSTNQMFICQEFHPISRGIFGFFPGAALTTPRRKVRVLLLLGVRRDDPETTPEEEVKWIREVFDAGLATDAVAMKVMRIASPSELEKELKPGRYDIVHFFGHGGFDAARKEGYLRFDGPGATSFRLYANDLGRLLTKRGIRLVFLNACETAKPSGSENPARSSVAAALLGRGIPAVIASQFSIPDTSAHFLSSMIYNQLVTGKPLAEAVRDGRRAMAYDAKSQFFDWGIPVLYCSDPDLVIFPRSTRKPEPKWARRYEKTLQSPDVIRNLAGPSAPHAPSISVERTAASPRRRSKVEVALIDIDSKVGFLPDLIVKANQAQSYYHFQVVYLPIPSGAVRRDIEGGEASPQLYLPRLDAYLKNTPRNLGVDMVCCLTRHKIAIEQDDYNYFTNVLNSNTKVTVISTSELRKYARQAKVSFAKATLYLCLAQLIEAHSRGRLEFHEETAGCLLDQCPGRDELVVGLRHMKFDHADCRKRIRDPEHLAAIDALLALDLKSSKSND